MHSETIRLINSFQAHGRNQISSLILNSQHPKQMLSIAQDGMIKKWNIQKLQLIKYQRIRRGYLTSLVYFDSGYLVGTGNGEVIKFNLNLEKQWTKKIHSDCITDILQNQKYLITVSYDGKICFIDKNLNSFHILKQIDLAVPLSKIVQIGDAIYVSGNPSYKINMNNFQITKLGRSHQIIQFKGRILLCSDQNGLQMLNSKQLESQQYIPCHFIIKFQQKLIAVTQQMLGIVDIKRNQEGYEYFSYRFFKANCLKQGYSIKAGLVDGNNLYLAGQDGYVSKFVIQLNKEL